MLYVVYENEIIGVSLVSHSCILLSVAGVADNRFIKSTRRYQIKAPFLLKSSNLNFEN
jgi:hypothetical protein